MNKSIENLKYKIKNKVEDKDNNEIGRLVYKKKELIDNISTISEEVKIINLNK